MQGAKRQSNAPLPNTADPTPQTISSRLKILVRSKAEICFEGEGVYKYSEVSKQIFNAAPRQKLESGGATGIRTRATSLRTMYCTNSTMAPIS